LPSSAAKRRKKTKSSGEQSPQDVLEGILTLRGYGAGPNFRIKAGDTCYDNVPSPLQLASFGTELVKAVHMSDVDSLRSLLAAGLSPNPCNQFRDSVLDLVCKRGNAAVFRCLVDAGAELRVCDGFGRTPLHHCCWAGQFSPEIADVILETDPQQLFMEDKRGQTPLEYVRPDQAAAWIEYLQGRADGLFPTGGTLPDVTSPKETRREGHLPDPPHALPLDLARALSSGEVTPQELADMDPATRAQYR
jgi:hypothetical protein